MKARYWFGLLLAVSLLPLAGACRPTPPLSELQKETKAPKTEAEYTGPPFVMSNPGLTREERRALRRQILSDYPAEDTPEHRAYVRLKNSTLWWIDIFQTAIGVKIVNIPLFGIPASEHPRPSFDPPFKVPLTPVPDL